KTYPRLPVIMFSALTQAGANAALNALSLGASDCVAKPASASNLADAIQKVRGELIPKIKALCDLDAVPRPAQSARPNNARGFTSQRHPTDRLNEPIEIIAIGVSTGGPNALAEILRELPANLPVPVVIVQHMPPLFTKYLAERLNAASGLEVREAVHGDPIAPGA